MEMDYALLCHNSFLFTRVSVNQMKDGHSCLYFTLVQHTTSSSLFIPSLPLSDTKRQRESQCCVVQEFGPAV